MKTLAELKRRAQDFTWELIEAPYKIDEDFHKRVGSVLEDGHWVRRVSSKHSNALKLGNSWLTYPPAKAVKFETSPFGGEDIIVSFLTAPMFGENLRYHLRPIKAK